MPRNDQARVSLVIPVRDGRATIGACLESVIAIRDAPGSPLDKIIVVDDASEDETPAIVRGFDVTLIGGDGKGPGSARNMGWRAARHPLVWFVDADCLARPDALDKLLGALTDESIAGVGGSYDNALPNSRLATLIHEEIATRHARMDERVNFLATFNVLYRRAALEELGGFDPRYRKAQDAEFAYRAVEAGHELRFARASRVVHHHPTSLAKYLTTQSAQGYWRVFLHLRHRSPSSGDSYSSLLDHAAPPLACLCVASLPLIVLPVGWIAPLILFASLFAMQLPMTVAIVARTKRPAHLLFAPMAFARSFARATGMCFGVLHALRRRDDTHAESPA